MQRLFDEDNAEPAERLRDNDDVVEPAERRADTDRPDTELTLGPMLLWGIFFGVVLLCGLSFGLGYSMGSRGARGASTNVRQAGTDAFAGTVSSQSKPAAAPQNITYQQPAATDLPPSESSSAAANSQNSGATSSTSANSSRPVVKPALPVASTVPTTAPGSALMVQIAAISHQEDADVLVGALSKRGYAVTVSRDPADSMLHVRTGPFSSRDEANAMRLKLLGDGYNAVVQP
ncbi:MAG: SPOR domain-containing protein [Terracidiphilus sp.]|jgi:cell division septation protein DedD